MLVYVAGPYSVGNPRDNTFKAMDAGEAVLMKGHYPFIPHLTHFFDKAKHRNLDYEMYLEWDMAFLLRCDALLRIPGDSPGADREEALARAMGLPVFHSVEEIPEADSRKVTLRV